MKCYRHDSPDAVAFCVWCGKAVCRDCVSPSESARVVCSENCATELKAESEALQMLLEKSNQVAQANAFYCHLTAGLSAAAAGAAWLWLPSPFLIGFTGASAVVLFIAGIWHGRVAKNRKL